MSNMEDLTECYVDDDGGQSSPVLAVEEQGPDGRQSLWVSVGPVFREGGIEGPGVWIDYQRRHMGSELSGPVLLTPEAWYELVEAVNTRLENFDPEAYKPRKKTEDYSREDSET